MANTEVMRVLDPSRDARALLEAAFNQRKLLLVGIDPPGDLESLPPDVIVRHDDQIDVEETLVLFGKTIIDAVADIAIGIKPNISFFERHRREGGLCALERLVLYCQTAHPHLVVIVDGKRNDIGKTAQAQADGIFGFRADGCTVNGYLGTDGLMPFVTYADGTKLVFPLIHTSNPSAAMVQDVTVMLSPEERQRFIMAYEASGRSQSEVPDQMPYFELVARMLDAFCMDQGNCGGVVGATYPEQMAAVRAVLPDAPLLVPGFGTQGGNIEETLYAGLNANGSGLLCNYSSGISEAHRKPEYEGKTFAESVGLAALKANTELNRFRRQTIALRLFEAADALLYGHYLYKSGRCGRVYVAKDSVLRDPANVQTLCRLMAEVLVGYVFDFVLGPADPGIGLSQFTALALAELGYDRVPSLYASKKGDSFVLKPDQAEMVTGRRVAVVDDVLTKGTTFEQVRAVIEAAGGEVVVLSVLWNRGGVTAETAGVPVESLITRQYPDYAPENCPQCQSGVPYNTDHGHGAQFYADHGQPP